MSSGSCLRPWALLPRLSFTLEGSFHAVACLAPLPQLLLCQPRQEGSTPFQLFLQKSGLSGIGLDRVSCSSFEPISVTLIGEPWVTGLFLTWGRGANALSVRKLDCCYQKEKGSMLGRQKTTDVHVSSKIPQICTLSPL